MSEKEIQPREVIERELVEQLINYMTELKGEVLNMSEAAHLRRITKHLLGKFKSLDNVSFDLLQPELVKDFFYDRYEILPEQLFDGGLPKGSPPALNRKELRVIWKRREKDSEKI